MTTAAGFPLPSLSRGRFVYTLPNKAALDSSTQAVEGEIYAYTDNALYDACGIRIAFAERTGGISTAPFDALDMGAPGLEDNAAYSEKVAINRCALVAALLGCEENHCLICPSQVHGDAIVEVHEEGVPAAREVQKRASEGADAVMVNCSHTAALLRFADCLPLILVAPNGAFSVVHCGWKGTIAHLAAKAAKRLVEIAACVPCEVNAYIGAYIHADCFEVDEEVAQKFVADFAPEFAYVNNVTGKWHVDLCACVKHDLQGCGLVSERIVDIDKCTVCDKKHFFSYRASGGVCGRHAAFAVRLEG